MVQPLDLDSVRWLAAADVSFSKKDPRLYAAVLLFSLPDLQLVEVCDQIAEATFPYIPGLLSFREAPALLPLFDRLSQKPDVILVDGQGMAHPRRFGIASHIGVLLDIPTIGCAKSRLVGTFNAVPAVRGQWTELVEDGEVVGRVLCTRDGVKPIFLSVGHRVDLESATELVLKVTQKYRLPEPIRRAHSWVNAMRKGEQKCR